jgi:glycosyltransferase family protein
MYWDIFIRLIYRIIWKITKPNFNDYKKYIERKGINLYPKIATIDETISEIILNKKSIARFGDGEIILCFGRGISFQSRDNLLRKRLREILKNNNIHCLIGLPEYNIQNFSTFCWQFWYENTKLLSSILNHKNKYYNSYITRTVNLNQIEKMLTIWEGRNVLFVFGKGSRFNIEHEIFNKVNQKYTIEGLAVNAWFEYEELKKTILEMIKPINNPLVICSLGPTATVLAYDLSRTVQTIDLGHLTNIYDMIKYNGISPEKLPTKTQNV